jgi:hypothetical protein
MVTKEELKALEKELKTKAPAMLAELAEREDFITREVVKVAITSGDFPKRKSPRLYDQELEKYTKLCLEYLRQVESSLKPMSEPTNTESSEQMEVQAEPYQLKIQELPGTKRPLIGPPKEPRSVPAPAGMVRLTVNIPQELHTELRIKALKQGTTVTNMVLKWAKGVVAKG